VLARVLAEALLSQEILNILCCIPPLVEKRRRFVLCESRLHPPSQPSRSYLTYLTYIHTTSRASIRCLALFAAASRATHASSRPLRHDPVLREHIRKSDLRASCLGCGGGIIDSSHFSRQLGDRGFFGNWDEGVPSLFSGVRFFY